MKKKLRIGLLIDDYNLPNWNIKMLEQVVNFEGSEIVLIIKNGSISNKKLGTIKQFISNIKYFLYTIYTNLDKRIFSFHPDVFEPRNISSILSLEKIKIIEVTPSQIASSEYLNETEIEEIKKYTIDILLKLGFGNLKGGIHNTSKYGIWSYSCGDSNLDINHPAAFWEVINKISFLNIKVLILKDSYECNKLLLNSRIQLYNLSVNRNLNKCYWKASAFLPDIIKDLYEIGEDEFLKKINILNKNPQFYSDQLYKLPTNKEMIVKGLRLIATYLSQKISNFFYFNQWLLLFDLDQNSNNTKEFFKFKKILPPKDRFYADPFIYKKDDKYFIFFEELIFSENKGFISVIEMDNSGKYTKPDKVLERDYHLSYPFLFEYQGNIYMIPETKTNNTIELYRCLEFPLKWDLEKVLIDDIKAVDTTIIFKDGKYWLFSYLVYFKGKFISEGLYLFSSADPLSDNWKYHSLNPIVHNATYARPAGNFFTYNNKLYRPVQDCSKHYGYGMKINQIIDLSNSDYMEKEVNSIYPNWNRKLISTHTLNSIDNLLIIDAQIRRSRF